MLTAGAEHVLLFDSYVGHRPKGMLYDLVSYEITREWTEQETPVKGWRVFTYETYDYEVCCVVAVKLS